LSGVIRGLPSRRLGVIAAATAALALSGCGTFSDNDVVAKVGDDELTDDEVQQLLDGTVEETEEVPYDAATAAISNWIIDRVLRADLAANDSGIDEVDGELTGDSLRTSFDASFAAWTTLEAGDIPPSRIAGSYGSGPSESGMVCASHILVATEDTADEILDRIDDGDEFADLAAEYSTDPGSAASGGALPCASLTTFANTYVPEFTSAVVEADVGDVVGPVESQFGYHVIWIRPFDDLTDADIDALLADALVRFSFAVDDAEVWVDPRFGEFDVSRGLVPVA
jgi:foldase protein PrsA